MDTQSIIASNPPIFKGFAGSISYGTNLPSSDVDYRGIFCADQINVRTPFFAVNEINDVTEEDTKYYELTHFMKLCVNCNPNIIEMLWIDESDIVTSSPSYELLRANRAKLLSSKIAHTTSGYAHAQLKRIKGHNKWINNPQSKSPPRQIDYLSMIQWFGDDKKFPRDFNALEYITNSRLVPYGKDIYGFYHNIHTDSLNTSRSSLCDNDGMLNTICDIERETLPTPSGIIKYNKDAYLAAKTIHTNYWTWKQNRNSARSELEELHSYDTKHAMHLVRLMRIGKEALSTGQILVKRPDAAELLEIRAGKLTYNELIQYADDMQNDINELYKYTALPRSVDLEFAAKLLMDVQDITWN